MGAADCAASSHHQADEQASPHTQLVRSYTAAVPHLVELIQRPPACGPPLPILVLQTVVLHDVVVVLVEPALQVQEAVQAVQVRWQFTHFYAGVVHSSVALHMFSCYPLPRCQPDPTPSPT